MGKTLTIDPDALTLGDMEELEDRYGVTWLADLVAKKAPLKMLIEVIWRIERLDNPELTLDEVRGWRMRDIDVGSEDDDAPGDGDVDPTRGSTDENEPAPEPALTPNGETPSGGTVAT